MVTYFTPLKHVQCDILHYEVLDLFTHVQCVEESSGLLTIIYYSSVDSHKLPLLAYYLYLSLPIFMTLSTYYIK